MQVFIGSCLVPFFAARMDRHKAAQRAAAALCGSSAQLGEAAGAAAADEEMGGAPSGKPSTVGDNFKEAGLEAEWEGTEEGGAGGGPGAGEGQWGSQPGGCEGGGSRSGSGGSGVADSGRGAMEVEVVQLHAEPERDAESASRRRHSVRGGAAE